MIQLTTRSKAASSKGSAVASATRAVTRSPNGASRVRAASTITGSTSVTVIRTDRWLRTTSAAIAPLPAPISSTSPSGGTPCSAHGKTTRRAKPRHGALRHTATSNRDIAGIRGERSEVRSAVVPGAAERDVDVCIVGAGYAGLAAAHRLVAEGRTVAVLEARDRV